MSEKLGETPAPEGAPEVAPEPGSFGAPERPRLGGLAAPIRFTDAQAAVINAVADTLIPPGRGFPAPSEVDVVDFFGRYLAPSGTRAVHYPFAAEDEFKAKLDGLGEAFANAGEAGRADALGRLERDDEEFFGQLRSLAYYGYYSMTEVTLAIRKNIPAGKDYHGPPQPYGYLDTTEPWDDATLSTRGGTADHIATEDVRRVDLSGIDWVRKQQTGAGSTSGGTS
jgi:hypothetical protein